MKILIKKENNLVCTINEVVAWNGEFYYSLNPSIPWEVSKIHVKNQNDFEILQLDNTVEIPDDTLDFKYVYNAEESKFIISDEWINNQEEVI